MTGDRGKHMPERRDAPPALAGDSLVDKSVRFGCGALLGMLIFAGLALFAEGIGLSGLVALGIVLVAVCGAFAVTHGEPFFVGLLKLIGWL